MPKLQILEALGFDAKTEKVYRALLSLADAPASRVAEKTGIVRTSVYHILENLIKSGLASSYTSRGVKRYFAESPVKLKSLFEQKMILAERIIPILQADVRQERGRVDIRVFTGREGIKSIQEEALETKEKTILSIGSSRQLLEFTGGKFGFGARRRRKNIFMRSLRFAEDGTDTRHHRLQETKLLPPGLELPGYFLIFGDKVGVIVFEENGLGFLVESRQFARIMGSIFDILWSIARQPRP